MTLDAVRTAITNTMKNDAALQALKVDVRTHRGRFTLDDLKTVAARPMSVLISCLGIRKADLQAGQVDCRCVWGAFVVTVDRPQMMRDAAALVIVSRLVTMIPGNLWGLDMSAPESVEGTNLYSGKMDEKGLAMWAVTWEQTVTFDPADQTTIGEFKLFHADWDLAPQDGQYDAGDTVDLPGSAET